jgi:putative ABC transport system permease protein
MKDRRRHLYPKDVVRTATLGPRGRPMRAILSAVGIGVGITALVAVLGFPASQQAENRAYYNAMGANVLTVKPGSGQTGGDATPVPETAPEMVGRITLVQATFTVRSVPDDTYIYRNDRIPTTESGGLAVWVGDGNPTATLNVTLADGRWFDAATRGLPTVVLGRKAAQQLGVGVGQMVWIDQAWWAVIGVFSKMSDYVSDYDRAAFLAPDYAATRFDDVPIDTLYVGTMTGQAGKVRTVLAATASPGQPSKVTVSPLSDFHAAQSQSEKTLSNLALGLGAVALVVGGIGIANTRVVAVMERRGEIGLRRALGARTGQIGLQFVFEAGLIGFLGGVIGIALGAYGVFVYTAYQSMAFAIPLWVVPAGPAMAAAVGVLAGLYPSLKAARQPPTTALRTV